MFIYCSEDDKRQIDRARRFTGHSLSKYVLRAALAQAAMDEKRELANQR